MIPSKIQTCLLYTSWKALVKKNSSTKSDEKEQVLPSVSVGDEPVSYTHLDVYKRQIPRSSAEPGDLIFFQGTYDTAGASHVGIDRKSVV